MLRSCGEQQEYINQLQKRLDQGLADKQEITRVWPSAKAELDWDSGTRLYRVRLMAYRIVIAEADLEHEAWSGALSALKEQGVYSAPVLTNPENRQETE